LAFPIFCKFHFGQNKLFYNFSDDICQILAQKFKYFKIKVQSKVQFFGQILHFGIENKLFCIF